MEIVRSVTDREVAFAELLDALESVCLYSRGFSAALCDTTWRHDALALHAAAERARMAAQKLAHWQRLSPP